MSSIQKSVYMNLYILALADGRLDNREVDFLSRFSKAADISDEKQQQWQQEVASRQLQFVPIESEDAVAESLALFARIVRVDDEFDPREQDAYLLIGKALGYTEDALGTALRKYWSEDPSFDFLAALKSDAPQAQSEPEGMRPEILLINDDQTELERFETSANQCSIQYCSLAEIGAQQDIGTMVIFQAAENSKASLARLQQLKRHFVKTKVAFLARRDQAPQIGYLLEHGADKCFVKPLFPNEINKAAMALQQDSAI